MAYGAGSSRKGYLRLTISGSGLERFLNLCSMNGIEPWDLSACGEDAAECCMELAQFRRIRPFACKAGVHVRIAGRYGLPFFIEKNRRREGAVCGILIFTGLLYALSLFVWNITFEGNYHYSRETLTEYLESLNIHCGMRKSGISCEDLEESLRSAFNEITWVSASVSGTRLIVRIKENEVLSAVPEKDDAPRELAASRAGLITRMIVRQGKACVSPGDTVEEGQLLVSSALSVLNDAGEVVRTKYVRADADVYAETAYSYRVRLPGLIREEVPTGRVRREYTLRIGAFRARLRLPARGEVSDGLRDGAAAFAAWLSEKTGLADLLPDSADLHSSGLWPLLERLGLSHLLTQPGRNEGRETQWNAASETIQLHLFGDFYLPVFGEETVTKEYAVYDRSRTKEELLAAADREQAKFLENLCEKGVHIIEKDVKILKYGADYLVEGTVRAEEEIANPRPPQVPEAPDEE